MKKRSRMHDIANRSGHQIKLDKKALSRCDSGIRRLLLMKNEDIIQAKEEDEKRIKSQLERVRKGKGRREKFVRLAKKTLRRPIGPLPHPVFGPVIIEKLKRIRRIRIRAIVDFAGNADDLKDIGIVVRSGIQNIFTINATIHQLARLVSQPATRKVGLPRLFLPHLADAVSTAEIDQIHLLGFRGNGTIVGIVDTTLHVVHHSFRDPNMPHSTRVRFMWVQEPDAANAPGQTPEGYSLDTVNHPNSPNFTGLNYGRIYDENAINTALGLPDPYGTGANQIAKEPSPPDVFGIRDPEHGTHVTGIAAGSGHFDNWATPPVNVGSAPQADIVHVCYRSLTGADVQNGVFEDDIIDALDFIMRIATHGGQPVVINNSYGTNLGSHNGLTDFDQARNAFLDSFLGRSLVFSAGNDNDVDGFRRGSIAAGATETFGMTPNQPWLSYPVWLEIWYSGPDLDFRIDRGANNTGWMTPPNEFHGTVGGRTIDVDRDVQAASGLKNIRLYIQQAPTGVKWTINLRNSNVNTAATYWSWVGIQGWLADLDGPSTAEMTLGDTACARSILTVGSCAKRVGGNPEVIADYSGCGPTLDGRIKPEITAVGGTWAMPVMSADSTTTGGYVGMPGTSMAAPLVAGAIALLFESDPDLNQDAIKALLTQNADRMGLDIDPGTPGYDPFERNAYGYGRLRMLAPFQYIRPPAEIDVWVRTAADDYGSEPYPGDCFCQAPEVKVLSAGGNETTTLDWGQEHMVQVRVHNLGDTPAAKTKVKIKYTRPWAAPDNWVPCKDSAGNPIEEEINIPGLSYVDLTFTQRWKPQTTDLPPDGTEWGDHHCLLVELDHLDDPLQYDDSTAVGRDPWIKNIKGTNNVALRNLTIH